MKQNRWSSSEIELLKKYRLEGKPTKTIAKLLRRSVLSITQKALRLNIPHIVICQDCNMRLEIKSGEKSRLRCIECAQKAIKIQKRAYDMTPKMQEYRRLKHDKLRFGGNRKKALERDLYACRECGATHHEQRLDVHHLDKRGRNKENQNMLKNIKKIRLSNDGQCLIPVKKS
jgi:hypothetical protein